MAVRTVYFKSEIPSIHFPSWVTVSCCTTHTHREIVKDSHGISIYNSTYDGVLHNSLYCQNRGIVSEVRIR